MSGQVALITGGVRGIGRVIAEALLDRGARVAVGYSRSWTAAEAFIERNGARGVSVHQGSIADPLDCERVVVEAIDRHGRLDILVNGACLTIDPMMEPGSEAWSARCAPTWRARSPWRAPPCRTCWPSGTAASSASARRVRMTRATVTR
ncbi:MAG: SDR family NAD(P)-dependent oxidoreductase [Thermoleophilia bacterium]